MGVLEYTVSTGHATFKRGTQLLNIFYRHRCPRNVKSTEQTTGTLKCNLVDFGKVTMLGQFKISQGTSCFGLNKGECQGEDKILHF